MSADYFAVATAIARKHEADRKAQVCRCDAYAFPHRLYSGDCAGPDSSLAEGRTRAAWDAEELALFNRAEADSINREARR